MLHIFKLFFLLFSFSFYAYSADRTESNSFEKPPSIVVIAYCATVPYPELLKDEEKSDIILICSDNETFPSKETKDLYKKIIRTNQFYDSGFVDQCVFELAQETKIKSIVSVNEWDILRSAALREALKIEGQDLKSAFAYRDKVVMKDFLKSKGIRVPPFQKVQGAVDILSFASFHGYPIVIKPTREAGAKGVTILQGEDELQLFLKSNHPALNYNGETGYEIEKYIKGKIFNINGLIYRGECIAVWPSEGVNTCLDLVRGKEFASYIIEGSHPLKNDLCDFAHQVIKALPSPGGCAFHLEVIYSDENHELYFLEVASRLGGGGIRHSWKQCFNIDLLHEHIRLSAGITPNIDKIKLITGPDFIVGDLWIPSQIGTLKEIPDSCPFDWVINYYPEMKPGKKVDNISRISDNLALAVIKARSAVEFNEYILLFIKWFNDHTLFE